MELPAGNPNPTSNPNPSNGCQLATPLLPKDVSFLLSSVPSMVTHLAWDVSRSSFYNDACAFRKRYNGDHDFSLRSTTHRSARHTPRWQRHQAAGTPGEVYSSVASKVISNKTTLVFVQVDQVICSLIEICLTSHLLRNTVYRRCVILHFVFTGDRGYFPRHAALPRSLFTDHWFLVVICKHYLTIHFYWDT